jgi:hypothetical protein
LFTTTTGTTTLPQPSEHPREDEKLAWDKDSKYGSVKQINGITTILSFGYLVNHDLQNTTQNKIEKTENWE